MYNKHYSDNSQKRDELAKSYLVQGEFTRHFLRNYPQLRDCTTRILDALYVSIHLASKEELHHIIDSWKESEKLLLKGQNNVPKSLTQQKCDAIDWFAKALKLKINYTLQSST